MTQRRGVRPTPAEHVTSGRWPHARVDVFEAAVAQEVALRLTEAKGHESWRELAERLELDFSTLAAIGRGARWIDSVTLARLEAGLGTRLWPDLEQLQQWRLHGP